MTISSNIRKVPDRAFVNVLKAKLRDPTRSLRILDFLTYRERVNLYYDVFGADGYEKWLDENAHRHNTLIEGDLTEVERYVDGAIRRGLDKDV